ncbi:MAG: RagB/SusD family nutrient uptake outer membrane protein [Muribaculum sp.]|nr:RagB/SusD family nutrient uptake outer membrane protein [Muribaculum sp.]
MYWKYLSAALVCSASAIFTSCDDSLLDLNNPNALVSEIAWNTQKDIESGLVGSYHTLYSSFYNSFNAFLISGQSDEFFSQSPDAQLAAFINIIYPNYDQRWNYYSWKYLYQGVFRSNLVIVHAEEVKWDSEASKTNVLAQARALRGMHYYYLAMLYKKAPIVDWISLPADQPKEATFDELVAFIEKDLLYAAENLPETQAEVGRVNKYFAYSFLGKLYMNSGQWSKAKDAFKKVVNSGKFQLVANYRDNFRHDTENNAESIWEIQNSDVNPWGGGYWGFANDGATPCYGSYREKFLSASPGGWGDYIVYNWMIDMYKDEMNKDGGYDIRLRDNIVYPDLFTDFPGEMVYKTYTDWRPDMWKQDAWCRKYTTDYYTATPGWITPINTRVLRYGEILLSYAECLIMADGAAGLTEATGYVDMIRERANMFPLAQSVHSACLNSPEAFLKRLRIEREKECCFEYDRFFDLRRWGLGTDAEYTAEVKARSKKFADNFKPGREWLPIPMEEVDNNPNLTQNDSY